MARVARFSVLKLGNRRRTRTAPEDSARGFPALPSRQLLELRSGHGTARSKLSARAGSGHGRTAGLAPPGCHIPAQRSGTRLAAPAPPRLVPRLSLAALTASCRGAGGIHQDPPGSASSRTRVLPHCLPPCPGREGEEGAGARVAAGRSCGL